ncbi:hypothetical protein V3C99_018078 [Haemonchus contortus]|uniref:HARE-HTH domain-containing protein n=1 Tax=Haemonchus contortus TaxID=6289 RepID=A0A7I4Z1X7_HAECO
MNTGNSIDADYEDLVEKITQAVKASSAATEAARRRHISPEGRVQTSNYRELCEVIRKKINYYYEGYRGKKLCEAAERRTVLARAVQTNAEKPIPKVMWEEVEYAVKQIKAGKAQAATTYVPSTWEQVDYLRLKRWPRASADTAVRREFRRHGRNHERYC